MITARLRSLIQADTRLIFRDKALWVFVFLPFLIAGLMYVGYPWVEAFLPGIQVYHPLVLGMMSAVSAISAAYLISFIMLDEKDQGVFEVLRIMPISSGQFILYRLALITLIGFLAACLTLFVGGRGELTVVQTIGLSALIALSGPLTNLLCINFAQNKIEGVTLLKGLNFILILPLVVMIIDPAWEMAMGIVPFYWVLLAMEEGVAGGEFVEMYIVIGTLLHLIFIAYLYRRFRNRIF